MAEEQNFVAGKIVTFGWDTEIMCYSRTSTIINMLYVFWYNEK
jgi:hypothetical protein